MIKKILILIIFLNLLVFNINQLHSISIRKITLEPLNRVNIYFDTIITEINHTLSDDKKSILIELNNNIFKIDTNIKSNGIIESVNIKNNGKSIIEVNLKVRRGYNILFLPGANNLMIEVFQWDKLSYFEDKFRTSLLSFNNSLSDISTDELISLSKEKIPNTSALLGLIYFSKGLINSAEKILNYSLELNDNIAEIYSTLYLINKIRNNTSKANEFKNKFFEITKLDTIYNFNIQINTALDNEEFNKLSFIDSLKNDKINQTVKNNSDTIILKEMTKDKLKENNENKLLLYILIVFGLFIITIISLYLKWRKNKLNDLIEKQKIKIPNTKFTKKNQLTELYKKNEQLNEQKEADTKKTQTEKKDINKDKEKENLLNVIKKVTEDIKESEKQKKEQEEIEKSKKSNIIPAKVEIALNIQEEQKKIRQKNLEELKNIIITTDKSKLTDISKKLGIEISGLEIKKEMEKLINDEKELENLKNKFLKKS